MKKLFKVALFTLLLSSCQFINSSQENSISSSLKHFNKYHSNLYYKVIVIHGRTQWLLPSIAYSDK